MKNFLINALLFRRKMHVFIRKIFSQRNIFTDIAFQENIFCWKHFSMVVSEWLNGGPTLSRDSLVVILGWPGSGMGYFGGGSRWLGGGPTVVHC
jgi:hypothetical protein